MIDAVAYQQWLEDPVTRSVFSALEDLARPRKLAQGLTEPDAAYALGYTTGFWEALDTARALEVIPDVEPEPTWERQ